MTKSTQKQSKPLTKRKKAKYPNLKKDLNLKNRREYIDTDYIDGVKNSKGEYVIRPLTNEEKEFLDTFYKEHVNASFSEKKGLFKVLDQDQRNALKVQRKLLSKEIETLQVKLNELVIKGNELKDLIESKNNELNDLIEIDKKKVCYDANNSRNRCLYNQAKKTGKLMYVDIENREDLHEVDYIINDKDLNKL